MNRTSCITLAIVALGLLACAEGVRTSGGGHHAASGAGGSAGATGTGASGQGGEGQDALSLPRAGDVVFTELMPDPTALSDYDAEWLEMINVSASTLTLEGCRLTDAGTNGDDHAIAAPVIIAPAEVLVFAKTADTSANGDLPAVAYAFGNEFALTNTGDEVRLECGGTLVDEVVYTSDWPFGEGVAMQLEPAAQNDHDNDLVANWCGASTNYYPSEQGTPGNASHHCE